MYEDSGYYDPTHDPNQIPPSLMTDIHNSNGFEDSIQIDIEDAAAAIGLDHHLGFVDMDPGLHPHLMGEEFMDVPPVVEAANWDPVSQAQYDHAAYGAAPDLLNMLQLPRCTVGPVFPPPPAAPISFNGPNIWADDGSMLYDPSLHLGYQGTHAPDVLRNLYQSLPQNYGLFCGVDEREGASGGVFQDIMDGRQFDGNMMDYRQREREGLGKGDGKGSFVTERERRQQLNGKYAALKTLIPNPTKNDRASIVGDAIEYINELLRSINELKILVQKKKHGRDRRAMLKSEDEAAADVESSSMRPPVDDLNHSSNGALRSSWLQRRSKESFIDVRIIDDEVNIKLNQKRKPNRLLYVAKALEELQLDIVHISGGNIGDSYIFMINTKICEGSSVYADAIAKKLLEVMDRLYPTLAFPSNY